MIFIACYYFFDAQSYGKVRFGVAASSGFVAIYPRGKRELRKKRKERKKGIP